MTKIPLEKGIVLVLFVLVLVTFSFAERDTKKKFQQYKVPSTAAVPARVRTPSLPPPVLIAVPQR